VKRSEITREEKKKMSLNKKKNLELNNNAAEVEDMNDMTNFLEEK